MFVILLTATSSLNLTSLESFANRTLPKALYYEPPTPYSLERSSSSPPNATFTYRFGSRLAHATVSSNSSAPALLWAWADGSDGWTYLTSRDPSSESIASRYLSLLVNSAEPPVLERSLSERVRRSDSSVDHQIVVILRIMGVDTVQALHYRSLSGGRDTFIAHSVVAGEGELF